MKKMKEENFIIGSMFEIICEQFLLRKKSKKLRRFPKWSVRLINRDRKSVGYFEKVFKPMKFTDQEQFFIHTRMPVSLYEMFNEKCVLKKINSRVNMPGAACIFDFVVSLRHLAHGVSNQDIAWSHKLGKTTVRNIVLETCEALWNVLSPIYLSEPTEAQYIDIAKEFSELWNMPNCVGAIDGKHFAISCPNNSGSMFYNYKKFFSIVLLATCDAKYTYTSVTVGSYGSESDGVDLPEIKGNHRKFRTLVSSYIALKHSPSKRKSLSKAIQRSVENDPEYRNINVSQSTVASSSHYPKTTAQMKSSANQNHSTSVVLTSSSTPLFNPGQSSQGLKQTTTPGTTTSSNFKVPPPVPPRGSPRLKKTSLIHEQRKLDQHRAPNSSGTTLSCSSTPPPAFDEISDDRSNKNSYHSFGQKSFQQHFERKIMNVGPAFRGSSKEETVSVSEIHLESYLGVDTSCGNQYGSRGGLAWTPPASGEGSTPTWTEGTPSYTDSSSSEDLENFSPINGAKIDRYKPTVEDALNSLTSEMVH